jgi:hypothetical protein
MSPWQWRLPCSLERSPSTKVSALGGRASLAWLISGECFLILLVRFGSTTSYSHICSTLRAPSATIAVADRTLPLRALGASKFRWSPSGSTIFQMARFWGIQLRSGTSSELILVLRRQRSSPYTIRSHTLLLCKHQVRAETLL